MKEAPVFVRAYDLYSWLFDRLMRPDSPAMIGEHVLEKARRLLEALVLALSRFDTHRRVIEADEQAALLRIHLRIAAEKEALSDRQLMHAMRELREIGRQIGGWRKKLEAIK